MLSTIEDTCVLACYLQLKKRVRFHGHLKMKCRSLSYLSSVKAVGGCFDKLIKDIHCGDNAFNHPLTLNIQVIVVICLLIDSYTCF